MPDVPESQRILESYLKGEIAQEVAVDAFVALLKTHRSGGFQVGSLALSKPEGASLSAHDLERVRALMAALDNRLART